MRPTTHFTALIADDETMVRHPTIRALSAEGFSCHAAVDGQQAWEMIEQAERPYDVVITDLRMPNRNGHALAVQLLEQPQRPLIVVLTGVLEPRLVKDLILRGVDQVELKPVDYLVFAAKVAALVKRRRKAQGDQTTAPAGSADAPAPPPVGDLMVRKVQTVRPNTPMREVAKKMAVTTVRHLPVVEAGGKLVGIITQRDVSRHLGRLFAVDDAAAEAPVSQLMATGLQTVAPDTPLSQAALKMITKRIGCLPVVEGDNQLVGILTRTDLLRHLLDRVTAQPA